MTVGHGMGWDEGVRSGAGVVPTDRSLLQQYRRGDQYAAELLYQRYAHRLRALAHARCSWDLAGRVDEDDIVQSVFRSFFRGVDRGTYDVPAGEELWNLFLVMTVNKVRAQGAYHRAAKRDVRNTTDDTPIRDYAGAPGADVPASVLLRVSVQEALDRLPEQHRRVIELRMEGYDVAEIAGLVGRAKRSVERMLQDGRERLGKLLLED